MADNQPKIIVSKDLGKSLGVQDNKVEIKIDPNPNNMLSVTSDGLLGINKTPNAQDERPPFLSIRQANMSQTVKNEFTFIKFTTKPEAMEQGSWDGQQYTIPKSGMYLIKSALRLTDYTNSGVEMYQAVATSASDVPGSIWTVKGEGRRFTQEHVQISYFNEGDKVGIVTWCQPTSTIWEASLQLIRISK